jgi:hypothetical protein
MFWGDITMLQHDPGGGYTIKYIAKTYPSCSSGRALA